MTQRSRPGPVQKTFAAIALLALAQASSCGGERPRFPGANLVLVSIDTLRADHLSLYGYGRVTSPHLDDFARTGVLFENAYSQSPKTATSHMTLFTGLHPGAHGVTNWWEGEADALSGAVPTLSTTLESQGYRCGAFTGGGNVAGALGFNRGFERYEDSGRGTLDDVVAWTEDAAGKGPYFLFFHTFEVHDPYLPPVPYDGTFDPAYDGPLRSSRTEEQASLNGTKYVYHEAFWRSFDRASPRERARLVALYDAEILYTDLVVSRLLSRLADRRLLENTVVVFTADHGEEFFEHGATLHNTLHEEVLRVPLLIRLPGGARGGSRVPDPVRLVDVKPTLLDLLGIASGESLLEGRSLLPAIFGRSLEAQPLYAEWKNPRRDMLALTEGGYKLIWDRLEKRRLLFDKTRDRAETQDISSTHPDLADRLEARLLELEASHLERRASQPGGRARLSAPELELEKLRALGYLDGETDEGDEGH